MQEPVKVLVVDDSLLYRKLVCDLLEDVPGVRVVGTAGNGKTALSRVADLKPDLLTLDVEMPEMNGLDVLRALRERGVEVGVIMFSSLTGHGSEMTVRALELGAFDFIEKPQSGTLEENRELLRQALAPRLLAFQRHAGRTHRSPQAAPAAGAGPLALRARILPPPRPALARVPIRVVGLGISTGGPAALARMLPRLPANLGAPLLIVQHMPPLFTKTLAESLNAKCALRVEEARDRTPLSPGTALIAPGGKQMKVAPGLPGSPAIIRLTDDPPENSCRPSADYLFRSLALHFGAAAAGVIMTGMGSDGVLGLRLMKERGATVIAQDEASCVVYGMPREPIESGIADIVAPLDDLAGVISRTVKP